jgi:hypothetical protein
MEHLSWVLTCAHAQRHPEDKGKIEVGYLKGLGFQKLGYKLLVTLNHWINNIYPLTSLHQKD